MSRHGVETWSTCPRQGQLSLLSKHLASLRDEHEALCECLASHGVVPGERLMAWLHRRRFAEARRRHPLQCHESLESLLQAKELSLTVAARLGLSGSATASAASRALRGSLAAVGPELVAMFPLHLYAIGGEAGGDALASVERLDVRENRWVQSAPLRSPRSGCAAVALSGHIYAVGGCGVDGEDLRSVERFSLWDSEWEEVPAMSTGRDELAAAACGGCLYAMGGSHLVWPVRHVLDSAEQFDPRSHCTGSWQALPRLSRERCAAAAVAVRRRLLVLGGCDEDGVALCSAESFDPTAGRWVPLPPMKRPRCNFAAAAAGGRVLVAGGYDDNTRDVDTVEHLDPWQSVGWESVARLPVPRWGVRAASSAGTIFIVGGKVNEYEVGDTQCMDHASGNWVSYAQLLQPRRSFGLAAVMQALMLGPFRAKLVPLRPHR
ncbi:IPP [Symbiodinium sp. CCMP2456]|nr:IPP [Symbiodinium sp. CCMP2456]